MYPVVPCSADVGIIAVADPGIPVAVVGKFVSGAGARGVRPGRSKAAGVGTCSSGVGTAIATAITSVG